MKWQLESSKFVNWEQKEEEEKKNTKKDKESFGKFIARMRKLNKWSQNDLICHMEGDFSKSRLSSIENDVKTETGKVILPKENTVVMLAQALQIPIVVMEAKLKAEPIPWEKVLIERYGEQRLTQAREIIDDALMVLEKMEEAKKKKTP